MRYLIQHRCEYNPSSVYGGIVKLDSDPYGCKGMMIMPISEKEILDSFDDALASSLDGCDYYPDQLALAAYARATKTYLPLTGNAYFAFQDTNSYRKQYRGYTPEQRCSLILSEWNRKHPDCFVEDPFATV